MSDLTFYDAVTAGAVPAGADAVAGYVDGRFRSLPALRLAHPGVLWLSICVGVASQAMVLDVEGGDATPEAAAEWIGEMHARGVQRPCIYCSLSTVPALEAVLRSHQLARNRIRLWTAHWTGRAHICSSACGVPMEEAAGATQYLNDSRRGFDVSLTSREWFKAVRHDYLERTIR